MRSFPFKINYKLSDMIDLYPVEDHLYIAQDRNETGSKQFIAIPLIQKQLFLDQLKHNFNLYEILPADVPIKPYFDCEIEYIDQMLYVEKITKFKTHLQNIWKDEFNIELSDSDFIILDSCKPDKLSYHIVINKCFFNSVAQLKIFILWMYKKLTDPDLLWVYNGKDNRKIFDKIPYGKNQNVRMINQSKKGKTQTLTSPSEIDQTLVRLFDTTDLIQINIEKYIPLVDTLPIYFKQKVNCNETKKPEEIQIENEEDHYKTPVQYIIDQSSSKYKKLSSETLITYEKVFIELINNHCLDHIAFTGSWNEWRNIGFALCNTWQDDHETGLRLFHMFSKINIEKYNKTTTDHEYPDFDKNILTRITWGTIIMQSKKGNKYKTDQIITEFIKLPKVIRNIHGDDFCSGELARILKQLYGSKYFSQNGILYTYNDIYWEKESTPYSNLFKFISNDFLLKAKEITQYNINKVLADHADLNLNGDKNDQTVIDQLKTYLDIQKIYTSNKVNFQKHLNTRNNRSAVISDFIQQVEDVTLNLDINGNLFAFTNCIFNLKSGQIHLSNPYDYITLTCGYPYEPPTTNIQEQDDKLNLLLYQIFPCEKMKTLALTMMASTMIGHQFIDMFINTGDGGNGKSVIVELIDSLIGDYTCKLPKEYLTQDLKLGADPILASCNNKRCIRVSEPDSGKKLKTAVIKTFTGDSGLTVRSIYKEGGSITLLNTLLMDVNKIPILDETGGNLRALVRRLVFICYDSTFITEQEMSEFETVPTNYFLGNTEFKSKKFQQEIRPYLFNLLLPICKDIIESNYSIGFIPPKSLSYKKLYFAKCDDIYEWFIDTYEQVDPTTNYTYISDILSEWKSSDSFKDLTKNEKRKYTNAHITSIFESNLVLKQNFKDRDQYIHISSTTIKLNKSAMIGWIKREDDTIKINITHT